MVQVFEVGAVDQRLHQRPPVSVPVGGKYPAKVFPYLAMLVTGSLTWEESLRQYGRTNEEP
jgi:hypothetical protein